jgi:hypothetical protein
VIGPVFKSGRKAAASDGSTGPMSPDGPTGSPDSLAAANPGRVWRQYRTVVNARPPAAAISPATIDAIFQPLVNQPPPSDDGPL